MKHTYPKIFTSACIDSGDLSHRMHIRGCVVLYDDLMELLASYYLGNPNITNAVLLSMICTYYASMEVNAQCGE